MKTAAAPSPRAGASGPSRNRWSASVANCSRSPSPQHSSKRSRRAAGDTDEHAPQLEIHLSELLEDCGEFARALEVLEAQRDRDPTFPRIAGRTDLYTLGVTLFELSTGRLPFNAGDVADQHRNAPRPDPAEGLDLYPRSLADLIQRMMSRSPEDRPESADQVARSLAGIIEGD
ncbi:MAG: hypothetical protein GY910_11440 [bacterium]|nr:hypothetical protein [bacterium]